MDDIFDPSSDGAFIGLEKMTYASYVLKYVTRRPAQAPTKLDVFSTMVLPTGSVLHTLSGADDTYTATDGTPDSTFPLVVNEKLPVWLKIHTKVADEHSRPLGVMDNVIYRPNKLLGFLTTFYQKHRRYHRILSDRSLGTMNGVLTWIDYSPLATMKVNGVLHEYRKFDILFRTILNQVAAIGTQKHHYIVLPQSGMVHGRSAFMRAFRDLSTNTLGSFKDDPTAFSLIHLLGFVYGFNNPVPVKPYKNDIKLLGKDSDVFTNLRTTSLLERLPDDILASINFILVHGDNAVVYNLEDLKRFSADPAFYTKMYRHVMNLRLQGTGLTETVNVDSDQFDKVIDKTSGEPDDNSASPDVTPVSDGVAPEKGAPVVSSSTMVTKTPSVLKPILKEEPLALTPDSSVKPTSYEAKIRETAASRLVHSELVNDKPLEKHNDLVDAHFQAQIGGKTIAELLQPPQLDHVSTKPMTFLSSTPEVSYQKSSLLALDETYQKHVYHHELVKVVSSLANHGFFISKVEETKVDTEMDRTTTYKFHLKDETGKAHHVHFTLPDIDKDGNMKLGGIEYRLTRQIANVPICKVSPYRVNLSSYYNKVQIERIQTKRFSFEEAIGKHILQLRSEGLLRATAGSCAYPDKTIPYDYTALSRRFVEIGFKDFTFHFGTDGCPLSSLNFDNQDTLKTVGDKFGICAGSKEGGFVLFWDQGNQIHLVAKDGALIKSWSSFIALLDEELGINEAVLKTPVEWTQANILNQTIPLIFILGYKFGLRKILDMIRLDYVFYPKGSKPVINSMDYAVKFSDGILVFNRYPIARSLLAAGLLWVDLKDIAFDSLDIPSTYLFVFEKKGMGNGIMKGITGFYDFFVDPITQQILTKMHEPTTFHELLLRANVMLSDYTCQDAASVALHRFRLYERFNGIVYKEIYRGLAKHRNNPNSKKPFSINPEAVFQKIVQDATVSLNDVINPVHEVKQRSNFTFTGSDGRTPQAIVLKDRIYPKDGLGVVSDAVPDSGKVGITAYLTASPRIDDVHGIPKPYKAGDPLDPPQLLSIGTMVMPGGTTDDGKRNSYLSIQISHYVPNHYDGETLSVRTGYDEVLPHLCSDTFATSAEDDGKVISIDDKQSVLTVRYKDTMTPVTGSLSTPYLDSVLGTFKDQNKIFGILVSDKDIANYPSGAIFSLTKTTNGKIIDRLRCDTVEAIPDKDVVRKYHAVIQDLLQGRIKALYYVRIQALGTMSPGLVKTYSFKEKHTPLSGSYVLQKRSCNVKVGDNFKTGDILVYNPGFFVPDPLTNQVTFKHGVLANVALIDKASNHEDACEISRDLSNRLKMSPCHLREVTMTSQAAIVTMVKVGDHVETSDAICVISDDYLVGSTDLNTDNLDIMEKLSRQTPSAGYSGTIKSIRFLYSCSRDKLSASLLSVLKTYEKEVREAHRALNPDADSKAIDKPGWVEPGTKYKGIDFTDDTIVLEFMIEETIAVSEGDKIVISNSAKSIVSMISEKQHYTESGLPIDMLFSTTSIINRIIYSPFMIGITERNMEALKDKVLEMYFD